MSKLRIEHGVNRTKRAKLQVSIDQAVASDIELMAAWSNNEAPYIVNELLRFAIAQSEEFQRYKTELPTSTSSPVATAKPSNTIAKAAAGPESKHDASPINPTVRG